MVIQRLWSMIPVFQYSRAFFLIYVPRESAKRAFVRLATGTAFCAVLVIRVPGFVLRGKVLLAFVTRIGVAGNTVTSFHDSASPILHLFTKAFQASS